MCTVDAQSVAGRERVGDAIHVYALQGHANEEAALERDFEWALDASLQENHFELYRDRNRVTAIGSQVEFLRALLDLSIAASRASDERYLRSTLSAQAAFVLSEIEQAQADIEREAIMINDAERARIGTAVRAFLSKLASAVTELQAEEQARPELSNMTDDR